MFVKLKIVFANVVNLFEHTLHSLFYQMHKYVFTLFNDYANRIII